MANNMAHLFVRIHDRNRTETIRAKSGIGIVICQSLTTQRPPGKTQQGNENMTELEQLTAEIEQINDALETLDEMLDALDRLNETLQFIIKSLKQREDSDNAQG